MKKKRLTLLLCLVWCLVAFTEGDYAELNTLMNARNAANFLPETKNIKFTVPKGTVGKVLHVKQFYSGNMGIEVELLNNKKGEKVWIYYWPDKKNLSFYKDNPLEKKNSEQVKAEDAKYTRTNTSSPAVRFVTKITINAKKDDLKKGLEVLEKLNGSSKNTCSTCSSLSESSFAGQKRQQSCSKKNAVVGHIEVFQDLTGGLCTVMIQPIKKYEAKWPRRYQINADGHFESIDPAGTRGYYFFPRKNNISYSISKDNKAVMIQTTSDVQIYISTETGKVIKVTNAKSAKEGAYNQALAADSEHLKIQPLPSNPILDLHFQKEGIPERKSRNNSTFYAGDGQSCKLSNTSLFSYHRKSDGELDVNFKFSKDADFLNLVKNKCH